MPLLKWKRGKSANGTIEHRLILNVGRSRSVATVWENGAWHTWDAHGVGGENSVEDSVERAKVEAAASAIAQGFV